MCILRGGDTLLCGVNICSHVRKEDQAQDSECPVSPSFLCGMAQGGIKEVRLSQLLCLAALRYTNACRKIKETKLEYVIRATDY